MSNLGIVVQQNLRLKLRSQIESVIPIYIERADFKFLNSAIGNDNALVNKKVAIVGAGSLGSYISEELLRSGIKNFVIIDDDVFEPANIMRHRLEFRYSGLSKAKCLAYRLESIHPEVVATPLKHEVSTANCLAILTNDIDIVLFTIGSTDTQIACNRVFKANAYSKTILYAWLEGDGESSHVAIIRYNRPGCFECLFTDDQGKYCPNKINVSNNIEPMIISNGCGGTRVAYGNSTLLSASKIVLEAIDDCINEVKSSSPNFVISYVNGQITRNNLPDCERCKCCK